MAKISKNNRPQKQQQQPGIEAQMEPATEDIF